MIPSITYAITCHNEDWELKRLFDSLQPYIQEHDQVLVQFDEDHVTKSVLQLLQRYEKSFRGAFRSVGFPLNDNFAEYKNHLKKNSLGDWIVQIDADEWIMTSLLISLLHILEENKNIDVIRVPRINTVSGITEQHVVKWGWHIQKIEHPLLRSVRLNDKISLEEISLLNKLGCIISNEDGAISYYEPVINFPDYQWRIYRNIPRILWKNKVHEVLTGYETYAELPADISYCFIHEKDIKRQEFQNEYYDRLSC